MVTSRSVFFVWLLCRHFIRNTQEADSYTNFSYLCQPRVCKNEMIDKATVDRILDAADIVDVVSDFVSLKRRGSNYVGLCPFHHEKTPSFSVSPSRGLCHCFGCGKGGSPVSFIMEIEQLSYVEALKWLAKKYNIEVHEREMTDRERQEQSARESMFIVNEVAAKLFEENLNTHPDGKQIGLAYFRERGFSDNMIKRFRLGYALDDRTALYDALTGKGYNRDIIISTGLCIDDNHGGGFDRFKGRAIFPVVNVAGKVVAFGGRTMRNEPAKYINSPESQIYHKSNELYGMYQAKSAIVKKGKCFLVEGYADVISMHQSGFDNTVASSGTSLTESQIRLIHRFTENVTVLYDGDSAGIKAALRGIDMLLAEGLNIKVLLLPDGHDPDSFARSHSSSEIEEYIDHNESDFIEFKMKILLEGLENDPIKRSSVIADVIRSIATIPSAITRSVYTKECSRRLEIDEQVLLNEVEKILAQNRRKESERRQKAAQHAQIEQESRPDQPSLATETPLEQPTLSPVRRIKGKSNERILYPHEEAVVRYIVKYGMSYLCDKVEEDGNTIHQSLLDYVAYELSIDNISFTNPVFQSIYEHALDSIADFEKDFAAFKAVVDERAAERHRRGIEEIQSDGVTAIADIEFRESRLAEAIEEERKQEITAFRVNYLEKLLCSSPEDDVRKMSSALCSEKHHLSKIHTRYSQVKSEYDRLTDLISDAVLNLKSAVILCQIKEIQRALPTITDEAQSKREMARIQQLYDIRSQLAKLIGERVVNPKI